MRHESLVDTLLVWVWHSTLDPSGPRHEGMHWCRRRKARAVQLTGEMTDELRAEMLAVPSSDTVAQLQQYIEAKQAEAESIVCGNNRVVEEHKCESRPLR